jgi:hypothetical protein
MGKGPNRRKGANDTNFSKGYDKIDHSKKGDRKEPPVKERSDGTKTFGPY